MNGTIEARWAAKLGARFIKEYERGAVTLTVTLVREGPVYETYVVESWYPDDSTRTHRIREPRTRERSALEKRLR